MLLFDLIAVGNKLLSARKSLGLTQAEAAERAGLSDRTYADIERGTVNMRMETFLRICKALGVTPDQILTDGASSDADKLEALLERLSACTPKEKNTAIDLLGVYLQSLGK